MGRRLVKNGDEMWPSDIPTDCPPADADHVQMVVYRFVKGSPPTQDDFTRPIDRPRKVLPAEEERCSLFALSVFADSEDIPVARRYIPGFKKRRIVQGTIEPGDGVVLNSPTEIGGSPSMNSHHDWWVAEGIDPLPKFSIVDL